MADEGGSVAGEQTGKKDTQMLWLGGMALAGLLCLSFVTVALVFLFRGQQMPSVQANPTINIQPSAAPQGLLRPSEAPKPTPIPRSPAQDVRGPVLPGKLSTGLQAREVAARREDPASPPYGPGDQKLPSKIFFRVRSLPRSEYDGGKALPMPVRYSVDSSSRVPGVYAAYQPGEADKAKFSFLPDRAFEDVVASSMRAELELSSPRLTSQLDGYRAPKGFQFFTAHLTLRNLGDVALNIEPDGFEIHDFDRVRYLPLPELVTDVFPGGGVAGGKAASFDLSFLVPDASPLKELSVRADGASLAAASLKER